MRPRPNNVAYIDGANLHRGVRELGWRLDYHRFRLWLREKFSVQYAFLFIGYVPQFSKLYEKLEEAGYILVFKDTILGDRGAVKGNCDAELVLKATSDEYEEYFDQAVLVTGDGDFGCLGFFLLGHNKLRAIVALNRDKCSYFIRRVRAPLVFLNGLQHLLSE